MKFDEIFFEACLIKKKYLDSSMNLHILCSFSNHKGFVTMRIYVQQVYVYGRNFIKGLNFPVHYRQNSGACFNIVILHKAYSY
jgi:hypothetical protein